MTLRIHQAPAKREAFRLDATSSAAMLEKSERQQDPAHPDDETLPGNLRESLPLSF